MNYKRKRLLGTTIVLALATGAVLLLPHGSSRDGSDHAAAPTTTAHRHSAGCRDCTHSRLRAEKTDPAHDLRALLPADGAMGVPLAALQGLRSLSLQDRTSLPLAGGGELAGKVIMASEDTQSGWWIRSISLDERPGATLTVDHKPDGSTGGIVMSRKSASFLKLEKVTDGMASFTAIDKSTILPECSFGIGEEGGPELPAAMPQPPVGVTASVVLNSRPQSENVLYLDFDGESVTNTWWNAYVGGAAIDAPESGFDAERITCIWRAVAEDFRPFAVNVTTDRAVYDSANPAKRMMNVFTPYRSWYSSNTGILGVAYIGTFGNQSAPVCWTFSGYVAAAEDDGLISSHEIGHTLGLNHDGMNGYGYYSGHGSGEMSWGPIMGNPFGLSVNQWSNGDYAGATNTQDDVTLMGNLLGRLSDDFPDTPENALLITGAHPGAIDQAGQIISREDVDVFKIEAGAGQLSLNFIPFRPDPQSTRGANLDIEAKLFRADGSLMVTSDPSNSASAGIASQVTRGTYYVQVAGTGLAGSNGYSDYGSLGGYAITGTYPLSFDHAADIEMDESPREIRLAAGQSRSGSLVIANSGDAPLSYALEGGELPLDAQAGSLWHRSAYRIADLEGQSFVSRHLWTNIPIPEQPGSFRLNFDITTSSGSIDGVTGLSETPADEWADLSAIVRANPAGYWDGWKSSAGYGKDATLVYGPGLVYHVAFDVNVQTDTYVLWVTPEGAAPVRVLASGKFRRNAAALRYLSLWTQTGGSHTVSNLRTESYTVPTASNPANAWINLPIPPQTGKFEISYDVEISSGSIDGVTGFSETAALNWTEMAVALRAAPDGTWDAHTGGSGGGFAKLNTLHYEAGTRYHVFQQIDVPAQTYRVTVTPETEGETVIMAGTFRKTAAALRYLTIRNVAGSQAVSNVCLDSGWYCGNDATRNNATAARTTGELVSRPFMVPDEVPELTFQEWAEIDDTCVAAVEVRPASGGSWVRLHRSIHTGQAWHRTTVSLENYIGMTVQLRFFYDSVDSSIGGYEGWYVDHPVIGGAGMIAWSHPGTTVNPGESITVDYTVSSGTRLPGAHETAIRIASNDPDEPFVEIPLTLKVDMHQEANDGMILLPEDQDTKEGRADEYPSELEVYGVPGVIGGISVKIDGFGHSYPADMDLLLAGPTGQKVLLMAGAGGSHPVADVNLEFVNGSYGHLLPANDTMVSGRYLPSILQDRGALPGAPSGTYSRSLDSFVGTNPNGIWKLYAYDRAGADSGEIGGWSVEFVMVDSTNRFETWAMAKFGQGNDSGGEDADPDGDGHANLIEYALGLDPKIRDSGTPVAMEISGGQYLTLRVNRHERRADIDYIVELSRDLATWDHGPGKTVTTIDSPTILQVREALPMSNSSEGFLRLRVERR